MEEIHTFIVLEQKQRQFANIWSMRFYSRRYIFNLHENQ